MLTTIELMNKLEAHYDGRKIYYQKWHKNSIRIAFRKYKDEKKQFKHTVRYYKNLLYGKIYPISTFKKIYLINSRRKWFIELEMAEDGWVEKEMEAKGYSHPAEVIPDVGVFRNGERIESELVFDNNRFNNQILESMLLQAK